ncbi:MAG: DHH family phosphoesterase [Cellulosilyticaceae bacterium]
MKSIISQIISKLQRENIQEVTLLGHDQIDEDSCISSLLMCEILQRHGIVSRFKILDQTIPKQTQAVLHELGYGLEQFQVKSTSEEENLFLVDHHQTIHPGRVVGCIDHHPTQKQFDYFIYDNGLASACSKKIYNYMVQDGMTITKQHIRMVAYALVIDTFDFKSPRGKLEDKVWLEDVIKDTCLDYEQMVDYALKVTDLSAPIEQVAMSSLKEYVFHGKKVMSTYILVKEESTQIQDIIVYLQHQVSRKKLAMWVFLVIDVIKSQTVEYRIFPKGYEKIKHPKLSSRAQEIMPKIEQLLVLK